jgi:outer membrane lipoprotein-sorting protein
MIFSVNVHRLQQALCVLLLLAIGCMPSFADQDQNDEQTFDSYTTIDPANPPDAFQQIQSGIQKISHFRAEFREEKKLSALSRSVRNSGYVLFDRERGLYRHVKRPFNTRQLITRDGLVVEKSDGNNRRKRLKPGSAPRLFLDSLYLVFSGRFSDFDEQFQIELKLNESENDNASHQGTTEKEEEPHWFLRLTPDGEKMKNFFSRMIIEGKGKQLKSFSMHRDNGDTTRTTFSNITYPDTLSEEQRSRFRSMKNE